MVETLADIGEFGVIRRIRELLEREGCSTAGVRVGVGDDTASFLPRPGHEILITCDSMVEDRHYLPAWIRPYELGRRAMVSNLSDIGAMGGVPLYALVSLGLREDVAVDYIEALYRGFLAELNPLAVAIIGGNLTGSGGKLFIDITLLGEMPEGRALRRSTARVGDSVLVTGYPGHAAAGLRLLLQRGHNKEIGGHPLVKAYLLPTHKAGAGRALALTGLVTAMIDTSDGFLGDLGHICEESHVGAVLNEESLPVSEDLIETSKILGMDPYELVLGDSDDYELIFTCQPRDVETIRSALKGLIAGPLTEVGAITPPEEGVRLISRNGEVREVKAAGWNHFSK